MRISRTVCRALMVLGLASPLAAGQGPDLFVGELPSMTFYNTTMGGITAFSVGTTSCNAGDTPLMWFTEGNVPVGYPPEWTNKHPVIAQNMFRYRVVGGVGQFEQIGLSFVKHGYSTLQGSTCFTDCVPDSRGGAFLGVHCSDPYSAGLNGSQGRLGPRSEVNAFTGDFPYPYSVSALPSLPPARDIHFRGQALDTDLLPDLNPGAAYFVEGHYISWDDAGAGNGTNNNSYRRFNLAYQPINGTFSSSMSGPTRRDRAAIYAWQEMDPGVQIEIADIPGEGRFLVGSRATRVSADRWAYEYAVQNLNSHRSASGFAVPIPACATVVSTGFRDVFYHSGEPYSGTDWAGTTTSAAVSWNSIPFAVDVNANALRWGTMYTYRFECDAGPTSNQATISLFRPGTPGTITVSVVAPGYCGCHADVDGDGDVDSDDLIVFFGTWDIGEQDYNGSGSTDSDDIIAYFSDFESGC
jgi:hypothetical protein